VFVKWLVAEDEIDESPMDHIKAPTLAELNAARRIAPFNTRHHPAVRETVLALAESDRRRAESLAGFARWAGIGIQRGINQIWRSSVVGAGERSLAGCTPT
jgi:hypothetical protein